MEWCSGAQKDLLVGVCRESIHLEGVAGEMGAPDGAVGVKPRSKTISTDCARS